jgi:predicted small secreted protein
MKFSRNLLGLLLAVLLCAQLLTACGTKDIYEDALAVSVTPEASKEPQNDAHDTITEDHIENTETEEASSATEESSEPETSNEPEVSSEPDEPAQEEHSALYLPDYTVEDVITFFNEVCLDAEFTYEGDSSLVQKWEVPIFYVVHGQPTDYDLVVLEGFVQLLNTIEGFPGMSPAGEEEIPNLQIHFCTLEEMVDLMGQESLGLDGMVRFWYMDNAIYDEIICCRTEPFQIVRNSVILEEIYNGLGPVQDTWLREDSIVYAGYSEPQVLTPMDELILKLLYHPDMRCGMNAEECEAVIRALYY